MKKILFLCFLSCVGGPLLAQKVYFIFIQSEANAPFYVRMGDKVLSSSASGYLILPKLKDSTYTLRLGPSANESELRFEVPVFGKDRGFLLKKFSEGWSLFDLQSLQRLNPDNAGGGAATGSRVQEDRFTSLLAKAANDTSLLYQPVIAAAPVAEKRKKKGTQTAPEQKVAVAELPITNTEEDAKTSLTQTETTSEIEAVQTATVQPSVLPEAEPSKALPENTVANVPDSNTGGDEVYKRSVVTRRSESATVEGFGLVYLDDVAGVVDTIRLTIPNQRVVFAEVAAPAEEAAPEVVKAAAPALACNGQASEKEYFKLRKNLASIDTESDMNKAALTAFRRNCFSAEQVKSLSSLFLTQAGKFAFLEAAYPFVYDREHFAALQSELFEPTYLTKFQTLTSN